VVVDEEVFVVEEGDEVAVVVEEEAEVSAVVTEWEVVAVVVKEVVVAEVLVVAVAHCVVVLQPNVLSRSLPPASYAWGLLVCSCVCSSRV